MTSGRKYTQACLLLLIAILILLGSASFGFSFLSYALLKSRADALVSDGSADRFTEGLYEKIGIAFRLMGIALLVYGALLYLMRERVMRYLSDLLTSARAFDRDVREQLRAALRAETKSHLGALLLIFLSAILIRILFLFVPMRGDESGTFLRYASRPLVIALSDYSTPNNHLFHTFLLHLSYMIFGDHPWAIRLPALLAGILLVPATYLVTRMLYNREAALLAAALIATSSALIEYSTNARGYTLLCLFFLLTIWLGAYLLRRQSTMAWLLFAVCAALGFYTIPVMLYAFGIVFTWLFLSMLLEKQGRDRIEGLKSLIIFSTVAAVLTCLLYFPAIAVAGLKAIAGNEYVRPLPLYVFVQRLPQALPFVWEQWNRDIPAPIQLILIVGFVASILAHGRLSRFRVPLLLAVMLWLTPLLLVQRVVPFTRVWLFLLPLYLIIASAGILYLLRPLYARINQGAVALVHALAVVLLMMWLGLMVARSPAVANSEDSLRDAEAITIFLKDYLKPGDRVLATADAIGPLHYYFHKHNLPFTYLNADPNLSSRILVVLKEPEHSIGTSIMIGTEGQEVLATSYGSPRTLRRFAFATLHEMVR